NLTYVGGLVNRRFGGTTYRTLPAGNSATWTATQNITQTTTNTVTARLGTSASGGMIRNIQTQTTDVTVSMEQLNVSCNTLWYSSDFISNSCSGEDNGSLG